MPYRATEDLPASVREALPEHAQEIYRAAYNNAWEEYADPNQRRGDEAREDVSRKVAWSAVKQHYEKDAASGEWRRARE